jgi:hypothetical protein
MWIAIVYAAYYIGLFKGLSRFHPEIIEKIKSYFS